MDTKLTIKKEAILGSIGNVVEFTHIKRWDYTDDKYQYAQIFLYYKYKEDTIANTLANREALQLINLALLLNNQMSRVSLVRNDTSAQVCITQMVGYPIPLKFDEVFDNTHKDFIEILNQYIQVHMPRAKGYDLFLKLNFRGD